MNFEWDKQKSDACFASRGFDFAYVTKTFLDPAKIIQKDARYDYGEARYVLLGKIESRLFCVIYTIRRGTMRIISARKANVREVAYYDNHFSNS